MRQASASIIGRLIPMRPVSQAEIVSAGTSNRAASCRWVNPTFRRHAFSAALVIGLFITNKLSYHTRGFKYTVRSEAEMRESTEEEIAAAETRRLETDALRAEREFEKPGWSE